MARRRLPIGIQNFRKIREQDFYYVDKTGYIRALLDEGTHYFLSRPRRFGKSLFLDTLKELFEGNEPLFEGLYIHDRWDWRVRYPVLHLSFGSGNFSEPGYLQANLMEQLAAVERRAGDRFGVRHSPRTLCVSIGNPSRPSRDSAWPSWWTNTTSRSSTRWKSPK